MEKRIFSEDLLKPNDDEGLVELLYEKKKRTILNIGLAVIYVGLLIISLFVV